MTTIVFMLTAFFFILVVYLVNKIQVDRQKFNSRIRILEDFIVQISKEQKAQNNQLLLSEELKQKLIHINATLNKDIYEVNFNLVEEIYPRK